MDKRALMIAVGVSLAAAQPARVWAGPEEEAATTGAAALTQSQGQAQGDISQARQKLQYDRLMRLIYNLEVLQGKIQIAGINATLSHPQGFVALAQTDAWCDMKIQGYCFGLNFEWKNVAAYHLSDLLKYHRQSISSLKEANAAAESVLRTLAEEAGNSTYEPDTQKTLQKLASDMELTGNLRKVSTDYYVSVHEFYVASFEATPHASPDVSLTGPKQYADVMGRTASLLQMQLDIVAKAVDRIRQYRAPNGAVLVNDRRALDAALEDPDNIVMLIFGKPGSRAAEVHDVALRMAEPWEKAFLVTDTSILTPEERQNWYQGDGSFVTLNLMDADWNSLAPEDKAQWKPGNYAKFNVAHAKLRKRWISDFDLPGLMPPSNRLMLLAWAQSECGEKCDGK